MIIDTERPLESIRTYLEAEVEMLSQLKRTRRGDYLSLSDFVLRNGMEFRQSTLPKSIKRGTIKQCYRNATELAIHNSDLVYCEGYALGVIPVMHAWCCDKYLNVIDNTWTGSISAGVGYFGVAIKTRYLVQLILRSQRYGIIDMWEQKFPILTDPVEEWRHPIMNTYDKTNT